MENPCYRFSKIANHIIGVVANNGILFSESALKGAHFLLKYAVRGKFQLFSYKT